MLLLTAHNAKGLEFPVVVVAGLEEGLFPHASSLEDSADLEEERRLFYVALTRARDRVVLTAAAYRRRFDGSRGGAVSRFVDEVPEDLLERELVPARPRRDEGGWGGRSAAHPLGAGARCRSKRVKRSRRIAPASTRHRAVGRSVYHAQFGRGVVMAVEDAWGDAKFTVRFGSTVRKVLGRFLSGEGTAMEHDEVRRVAELARLEIPDRDLARTAGGAVGGARVRGRAPAPRSVGLPADVVRPGRRAPARGCARRSEADRRAGDRRGAGERGRFLPRAADRREPPAVSRSR